MKAHGTLFLEDLSIDQTFRSGEQSLDQDTIIAFARQYDPQPFHTDPEAARDTFFRGLAASGWHTMAISMKLITESVPLAHGIIGAGGEIAWPTAARPGDSLHVESRVVAIRPSKSKPSQALVTLESRTLNQQGEVRQVLSSKVLVFRRDS